MATFSKEELEYIATQVKPYLLDLTRADSLELDDVAVVDKYGGVTSLPAYDNSGGLKRVVRVPISLLAKPAEDAAANLSDIANHPTYIGEDFYVYKWNNATKTYEKTDIFVKGEAFKVDVIWASEEEMKADTNVYNEGTYGMISTGDVEQQENGIVYVYKEGSWEFFVDMSGKRGETGKTAQFEIGTVEKGDEASVTIVENDEDENGNPIYLINFVLPKGDKGDQGEQGEQGKTPIFEIGDIITLEPNEQATAELVFNGATTDGTPKYKLTISIPRGAKGENGSGSGNVLVATSGLVSGKTYLFKPNDNDSAEGTFVEYEIPEIDTSTLVTDSELTEALKSKQDWIEDLENIRQGANREIPTKVSQLENDEGFLKVHQDVSNLATKEEVITIEANALQAKNDASIAKTEAIKASTNASEALRQAQVSTDAIATLKGLENSDEAMAIIAAEITKIAQNSSDIKGLKEMIVTMTEEEYEAMEDIDQAKIYMLY